MTEYLRNRSVAWWFAQACGGVITVFVMLVFIVLITMFD